MKFLSHIEPIYLPSGCRQINLDQGMIYAKATEEREFGLIAI